MENIIEVFGFEKCLEEEDTIYYRAMVGYIKQSFFRLKYYINGSNPQVMIFTLNKNKEYDSIQRTIYFKPIKNLKWKIHFMKGYQKYTGCGLKKVVEIIDSGELVTNTELEYEFIKMFMLNIRFDILPTPESI